MSQQGGLGGPAPVAVYGKPVPGPADLPPIVFQDFRPGIADDPGVSYPPEQAARTNTFRCISNRAGALTPAPRRTTTLLGTHFEGSSPSVSPGYLITGLYAAGPTQTVGGTASTSGFTHELWIATEYLTGTNRKFKLQRRRQFESPITSDLIKDISRADVTAALIAWGVTFGTSRSNKAAPTVPGIPIVVAGWGSIANTADSFVTVFPDDATPTVNTPYDVETGNQVLITTHQGRIVIRRQSAYRHGVASGWNPTEDLRWTNVFNPGVLSTLTNFVPENPDGYSIMAPMSANELFALKSSFGVVFQGDLDNPIVINLPMVPGTYIGQSGVVTCIGLLYGNPQSGVWAWSHGDSAKLLSPRLNPTFWQLPGGYYIAQQYQWATISDLVFISNNWVLDTNTGSWWRLEDDTILQTRFLTTDWTKQYVYGSVTSYTNESDTIAYMWDNTLGAVSYSWQSQPIWQSIDRTLIIRELELIAQGQGSVTLTCTGADGATQSEVINLKNTGYPERFRRTFAIQGQYLQLRIEANSGSASVDAPTVFSATLHPATRGRLSASA